MFKTLGLSVLDSLKSMVETLDRRDGGFATYRAPHVTAQYRPNGKRECVRRLRQIAAGSLRVENGLVA